MDLDEIMNEANKIQSCLNVVEHSCSIIRQKLDNMRGNLGRYNDTKTLSDQISQYLEYYNIVCDNIRDKYTFLADKMKKYVVQSRENARIAEAKLRELNTRINDMIAALKQAL